jgi:RNA polymerase sigma factor (sigma-70 family)
MPNLPDKPKTQYFPTSIVYTSIMTKNVHALTVERTREIETVFRRERERLAEFIRKRVRNATDAEDILQDVFQQFALWYDEPLSIVDVGAWLFKVARNKIIDSYRKRRRNGESTGNSAGELTDEEVQTDAIDSPDQLFLRSAIWDQLSEALDELPPAQRDVFVMNELEGLSFREIAEITGAPLNTLLSRKRYAVLYLRERLRDLYNEFTTL